jgi:hypothetical protein
MPNLKPLGFTDDRIECPYCGSRQTSIDPESHVWDCAECLKMWTADGSPMPHYRPGNMNKPEPASTDVEHHKDALFAGIQDVLRKIAGIVISAGRMPANEDARSYTAGLILGGLTDERWLHLFRSFFDSLLDKDHRVVTDIRNCARCDGKHAALLFHKMQRSFQVIGSEWQWWATCPTTGDPILLMDDFFPEVDRNAEPKPARDAQLDTGTAGPAELYDRVRRYLITVLAEIEGTPVRSLGAEQILARLRYNFFARRILRAWLDTIDAPDPEGDDATVAEPGGPAFIEVSFRESLEMIMWGVRHDATSLASAVIRALHSNRELRGLFQRFINSIPAYKAGDWVTFPDTSGAPWKGKVVGRQYDANVGAWLYSIHRPFGNVQEYMRWEREITPYQEN